MSRNSSESKTSPHSRHSTNSVSSCRETIRTLGCLQMVAISYGRCRSGLFPQDCSGPVNNLKRIFVNLPCLEGFPTETGNGGGHSLKADRNGRILNTDRTSRIFPHAQADQKGGLRVDGAQVPCRAPGDACAERQGYRRRVRDSSPASGQDSAAADQDRAAQV